MGRSKFEIVPKVFRLGTLFPLSTQPPADAGVAQLSTPVRHWSSSCSLLLVGREGQRIGTRGYSELRVRALAFVLLENTIDPFVVLDLPVRIVPFTSKAKEGLLVPTPTFPEPSMRILSLVA